VGSRRWREKSEWTEWVEESGPGPLLGISNHCPASIETSLCQQMYGIASLYSATSPTLDFQSPFLVIRV
jgi:hypothetical protein